MGGFSRGGSVIKGAIPSSFDLHSFSFIFSSFFPRWKFVILLVLLEQNWNRIWVNFIHSWIIYVGDWAQEKTEKFWQQSSILSFVPFFFPFSYRLLDHNYWREGEKIANWKVKRKFLSNIIMEMAHIKKHFFWLGFYLTQESVSVVIFLTEN